MAPTYCKYPCLGTDSAQELQMRYFTLFHTILKAQRSSDTLGHVGSGPPHVAPPRDRQGTASWVATPTPPRPVPVTTRGHSLRAGQQQRQQICLAGGRWGRFLSTERFLWAVAHVLADENIYPPPGFGSGVCCSRERAELQPLSLLRRAGDDTAPTHSAHARDTPHPQGSSVRPR